MEVCLFLILAKLRIQSNNFDTLYVIMTELIARMKRINPNFKLIYIEALPLKDLFDVVEERRSIAVSYNKVSADLQEQTNQLLFIQKRLLTRYKETNSASMNNLDLLLEAAVTDMIDTTRELEQLQLLYKKNSQKVAMSMKILNSLLAMRFPMSNDGVALLHKYLPTYVEPTVQDIGWVEIIDINIFYLLKNVLAGSNDQSVTAYPKIEDIEIFKKHFTLLIDKISKGLLANYKAPPEEN
jgi:PTHB1 C-terminus